MGVATTQTGQDMKDGPTELRKTRTIIDRFDIAKFSGDDGSKQLLIYLADLQDALDTSEASHIICSSLPVA